MTRWSLVEVPVRTVAVVMVDVFREHHLKVPPPEDENPVQTLASDRANETLGNRVGAGRSNRRPNDRHSLGGQHPIEGGSELGVVAAD